MTARCGSSSTGTHRTPAITPRRSAPRRLTWILPVRGNSAQRRMELESTSSRSRAPMQGSLRVGDGTTERPRRGLSRRLTGPQASALRSRGDHGNVPMMRREWLFFSIQSRTTMSSTCRKEDVEALYTAQVVPSTGITLDYQFVLHPAYNADRGPVNIFAVRVHTEL